MLQKKIEAWVEDHRQELIEDIKTLVRIPSDKGEPQPGMPYGPGPAAALQAALEMAQSYGFQVENLEGQVGTVDFLPKNDHHLDILSHLDCVPVAEGWTVTKPFEPVVRDGKLYGRGTSDDKGPSVAALYAIRCLRELEIPLRHNVRLIWGCDEECGSSDIEYYYAREPEAVCTFTPDAEFPLINIEKGGLFGTITGAWQETSAFPRIRRIDGGLKINVVPDTCRMVVEGMRKGVAEIYCAGAFERTGVRFSVTELDQGMIAIDAQGVGAHAASPENGNNAITAMLDLAASMHFPDSEQFRKLCGLSLLMPHGDWSGKGLGVCMEDEISGPLTLSLDIIHVTETGLEAQFDTRCPICATDENMKQVIAAGCRAHGLVLMDTPVRPPHHVSGDSPFVKTLLASYSRYTGDPNPKPIAIGGGTYCHELKNGVAFGCTMPGTDNHMHGNDEFAVVEELVTSVKIFAHAIAELCG